MYAYQLFEQLKEQSQSAYNKLGNNAVGNLAENLFYDLCDIGFGDKNAVELIYGGFACVACNDGKVSYDEFRAFATFLKNDPSFNYDKFFDIMSMFNKQQRRDRTIDLFNSINDADIALSFVLLCVVTCIVDNRLHENEEAFCTSLCEVYLNRFEY
jgi:hypothetical protein